MRGYKKGSSYNPGDKFTDEEIGDTCNVVLIDDEWHFIDVYWASPYSKVLPDEDEGWTQVESGEMTLTESGHRKLPDLDEFFFLPDPDEFIYLHLPKESEWQLLETNLSMEDFESLAYIERPFFGLDMKLKENSQKCIVIPADGETDLNFSIPREKAEYLRYSYTYFMKKDENSDSNNEAANDRYVLNQKSADNLSFKVRFPAAGEYKLEIYGGVKEPNSTIISLKLLGTYVFKCSDTKDNVKPFPERPGIGWGPGLEADRVGLDALSHRDAFIKTSDGNIDIRFGVKDTLAVLPSLWKDDVDDIQVPVLNHVMCYKDGSGLAIKVQLPQKGEYTLKLFGDTKRKQFLPNICNYLLHCSCDDDVTIMPYPRLHNSVLGPSHLAPMLRIEASDQLSHILDTSDGILKLSFTCSGYIELVAELHSPVRQAVDTTKEITRSEEDTLTSFDLDITQPGEYGLNVFAIRHGDNRLYHIHTYLIHYQVNDASPNKDSILPPHTVPDATVQTVGSQMEVSLPTHEYPLVAELQKVNAFEPLPNIKLSFVTKDNSETFNLKNLPVSQDYKLDIYEKRDQGVLVHIHAANLHRQPGIVFF